MKANQTEKENQEEVELTQTDREQNFQFMNELRFFDYSWG
jgi:hypothetical protein